MNSPRDPHQERFVQLMATCEQSLVRYVRMLVPHHEDARDVLQETAAMLWEKMDEYDADRPFSAWARKFAYIQVVRHHRRQSKRQMLSMSETMLERLTKDFDEHHLVLETRAEALAGCVEKLPDADYTLLNQRYWQKTNMRSLAAETGQSEHQVYRRLQRIRLNLRKCIEETIGEETFPSG